MKTRKIKQIIMAVVALMALLPMRSMAVSATLSIEDFTIKGGETKTMLIDVNNADMQVTLVQFDMRLPQGLSVAMKDGDYAIDIAGRTTYKKHSVSVNLIDGLLRVMLHSSNREVLSGTSGAVLGVTLTAASGFSSGKIQLENIKIVAPDASATTSKPGTYIYNVSDAVTLTAKSYTRQYGETNPTFGYEVTSGTITSGTPTITCSATATSPVGTYDIVIAKGSVTNGTVNLVKGTLTITKAPLTISAGSYTKVEGDANPTFTPTFSGFKNGETKNVLTKQPTITCTATTASTPGSYPVTVSGAEAQNYSISYVNGTLTVTAKVVPEPYAALSDDGKTVTFYYDGLKASRGGVEISNSGSLPPYATATTAVIDASFADYRPTSTAYWFYNCRLTSITGMENLHTDNVTDMSGMFYYCSYLTSLDLSGFKTENVTNMASMFSGCFGLTSLDVSGWTNDNVTDMSSMFYNCSSLMSLDVSGFKTDNVTSMYHMFDECSKLTSLDVNGFKTDNVTNMSHMFYKCSSLMSLDVSGFKTDNVTDMYGMFGGCSSLTSLDLSGFKTSKVTRMDYMFSGCFGLTSLDLSGFSTDNVWTMESMFYRCGGLTALDVSGFKTDKVKTMKYMFGLCTGLTSLDVSGWTNDKVTDMGLMFDDCRSLTSLDLSGFKTDNVTGMYGMFQKCSKLTSLDVSGFNTANVTGMNQMFYNCSSLTSLDVSGFKTDNVTDMRWMFWGCSGLTSLDVSGFKTDNVTDMSGMFGGCSSLTSLDLSGFKTDNVLNMGGMFQNCSSLTSIDVSEFKTGNVTNMSSMFSGCSNLTSLDLSGFKTDKVTNMEYMFYRCTSLTSLDLSGFKTDNVLNMDRMFSNCSKLTSLDLSGLNTGNVTNMYNMFYGCSSLKTIYASEENWSTANVSYGNDMFTGCTSLVGGNGTKFDANHTDVEYACIDKEGQPGYLTEKRKSLTPSSGEEEVYGSDDDGQYDDLDGNVIGNILYSIDPTDGGYNKSEGCIEVTKPTSDDDMDAIAGKDPFGEDVRSNFTGIIFMVSAGKGTIKVNAETTGGMLLKVKIGNDEPTEMELDGKLKATFHYNVTKPTYVYIYASYSGAASARGNGEEPSLKIYGIEWKQDAGTPTGVDSLTTNPSLKDEGSVYTLGGQRIDALPKKKGVYIRGGKKFVR